MQKNTVRPSHRSVGWSVCGVGGGGWGWWWCGGGDLVNYLYISSRVLWRLAKRSKEGVGRVCEEGRVEREESHHDPPHTTMTAVCEHARCAHMYVCVCFCDARGRERLFFSVSVSVSMRACVLVVYTRTYNSSTLLFFCVHCFSLFSDENGPSRDACVVEISSTILLLLLLLLWLGETGGSGGGVYRFCSA